MHVRNAEIDESVLPRPDAEVLDRQPALLVCLLDPLRMNPAVRDKPF